MSELPQAAWLAWHWLTHLTGLQLTEWTATFCTVYGAWLLADKGRFASWGFVLFLAANALWIGYALQTSQHGLLVQQIALTAVSAIGIWKGLVAPWIEAIFEQHIAETKL